MASVCQCLCYAFLAALAALNGLGPPSLLFAGASTFSALLPRRIRHSGPGVSSVRWLAAFPIALILAGLGWLGTSARMEPIQFVLLGGPPWLLAAGVWWPYDEERKTEGRRLE